METWEGDTPRSLPSLPNELPRLHPLLSGFPLQPIRAHTWCPTLGGSTPSSIPPWALPCPTHTNPIHCSPTLPHPQKPRPLCPRSAPPIVILHFKLRPP